MRRIRCIGVRPTNRLLISITLFAALLTASVHLQAEFALMTARSGLLTRLRVPAQPDFVPLPRSIASETREFPGRLFLSMDQLPGDRSFDCVDTAVSDLRFPICTYKREEDLISRVLLQGYRYYFERQAVEHVLGVVSAEERRSMDFVDIGANIGVYALPVARLTHVVAVEPYWRSVLRLAKSAQLGDVQGNVTIVYNAVSDEIGRVPLGMYPGNQGGTYMQTSSGGGCRRGLPCAETILLNDLLPLMHHRRAVMKVDVEGHQARVFTNLTAGKFFQEIDVFLIFMEWNLCSDWQICDVCKHRDEVANLLTFFRSRNYTFFQLNFTDSEYYPLDSDCSTWPFDVVLKKTDSHNIS